MKTCTFILLALILSITTNQNQFGAAAQKQRRQRKQKERDITAEEIEQITDDQAIEESPDELEKKAMMEEWD